MIVKNDRDLRGMKRIGQICGETLLHMMQHVEPGITTVELDRIGAAFLKKQGAASAPITAYKYPGWTCISINDAAAHGIPGEEVVREGDLVNIDVSAILEGYWGDTGATVAVPPVKPEHTRLMEHTIEALYAGIGAAKAGAEVNQIGRAVEQVIKRGGYRTFRELGGHGVGRHIHEKPSVHNYYNRRDRAILEEGLVITIEPFVNPGKGRIYTDKDGWTLRTVDGTVSCQFEHTVIINGDEPILATKVDGGH